MIYRILILLVTLSMIVSAANNGKPITINEENWTQILEGEWMVEFMAPWCPACRAFTETWKKFAEWSNDLEIKVGVVDVTENPGLSGRFLVSALPTVYHVKNGDFRQYKGGRKDTELITFIDDKKYEDIEPVVWYLSPGSIQMGAVGIFFKAAMKIRALYNVMTSEYGIPEWACYLIFAILTIGAGLLLGLMIVCCCDMVFPTRYVHPPLQQTLPDGTRPSQEEEESDVETETDDILDDTQHTEEEDLSQTDEDEPTDKTDDDKAEAEKDDDNLKPRHRKGNKAAEDLSRTDDAEPTDKTDDDKTEEAEEDADNVKPRRRRAKKAD